MLPKRAFLAMVCIACNPPTKADRSGDSTDPSLGDTSPPTGGTTHGGDGDDSGEPCAEETWFLDVDGDGYGQTSASTLSCEAPTGYVAAPGDCDDDRPDVSPGALERCLADSVDEDCDREVDEGCLVGELDATNAAHILTASDDADAFGEGVTWLSDLDGDGHGELYVSGHSAAAGGAETVWVFHGPSIRDSATLDASDAIWTFHARSSTVDPNFGSGPLSDDVNGDSYPDLVLGTLPGRSASDPPGHFAVWMGPVDTGSTTIHSADIVVTGAAAGDGFGPRSAIVPCATLDDAGRCAPWVASGAQWYNTTSEVSNSGGVWLFDLTSTESNTSTTDAVATFLHPTNADAYGFQVLSDDFNADGFSDLIVTSAEDNAAAGTDSGSVSLYLNGGTGWSGAQDTRAPDALVSGATSLDAFGHHVYSADLDADGRPELFVRAKQGGPSPDVESGSAYILRSDALLAAGSDGTVRVTDTVDDLPLAAITFVGTRHDENAATAKPAGDLNHDGHPDVVVTQETEEGEPGVMVWFGPFDLDTPYSISLDIRVGDTDGPDLALSGDMTVLGRAGDVTADGIDDLVMAVQSTEETVRDAVWIFPGQ